MPTSMLPEPTQDRSPLFARHRPLGRCALSIAALLIGGIGFVGGSCRDGEAAPVPGAPEARVAELIEAFTPLDRTVTSDVTDARFHRAQELQAELSKAGPAVGHAALMALKETHEKPIDVERALVTVAARAGTAEALSLLETLVTHYGPHMSLRTEAVTLIAEVAPERAIVVLEPIVTVQKHQSTMPDTEFLLRAWVVACDKTGRSPVPELCDVATNLFMPGIARVVAVKELGKRRDPRGEAALRTILVESTGDGYLRRMAAQSIHAVLPGETACLLLREVASREADMNFLRFLIDALDKWCSDGGSPATSDDRR